MFKTREIRLLIFKKSPDFTHVFHLHSPCFPWLLVIFHRIRQHLSWYSTVFNTSLIKGWKPSMCPVETFHTVRRGLKIPLENFPRHFRMKKTSGGKPRKHGWNTCFQGVSKHIFHRTEGRDWIAALLRSKTAGTQASGSTKKAETRWWIPAISTKHGNSSARKSKATTPSTPCRSTRFSDVSNRKPSPTASLSWPPTRHSSKTKSNAASWERSSRPWKTCSESTIS